MIAITTRSSTSVNARAAARAGIRDLVITA
jgi:hypothetical protein